MDQQLELQSLRYHLLILCLWQERGDTPQDRHTWRFSLEHPHTAERHGFKDLGELIAFLVHWTTTMQTDEPAD